jgi:hypothetical protein
MVNEQPKPLVPLDQPLDRTVVSVETTVLELDTDALTLPDIHATQAE